MPRSVYGILLLSFLLVSCDSNSDDPSPNPLTCSLGAEQSLVSPFSSDAFTVVYQATRTGDGSISSLTYTDAAGNSQSVANPSLPWSQTETLNVGANAAIGANGSVTNGGLNISFSATNGSATVDGSDSCAQTG